MTEEGAVAVQDPRGVVDDRPRPLIFLDTETTGLRPDEHTPWEVGWVTALHYPARWDDTAGAMLHGRLEVFEERAMLAVLAAHERLRASDAALAVGKFYERYSEDAAVAPLAIVDRLVADVASITYHANRGHEGERRFDCHLVGAVPGFDHAMLTRWLGWPDFKEGLYHYHLIDVEALAAGVLMMPPPWDTRRINELLGVQSDESTKHTALGDAVWAMDVYARIFHLSIERVPF